MTIGSGPYDFETSISATGANFKRKIGYWKGKDGPVEQIVYKIQESNVSVAQLKAGELDLVIRVPPLEGPGLASVAGLKQDNAPGVGIFALNFNHAQTDKAFRQAIAYAINRPEIIEQVLGGLATLNYGIPPGFRLYDDLDKYEFDVDKAKELLATSTFADKKVHRAGLPRRGSELHADRPGVPAADPGEPRHHGRAVGVPDGAVRRVHREHRPTGRSTSRSAAPRASAGTSPRSTPSARASASRNLKLDVGGDRGECTVHPALQGGRRPDG